MNLFAGLFLQVELLSICYNHYNHYSCLQIIQHVWSEILGISVTEIQVSFREGTIS